MRFEISVVIPTYNRGKDLCNTITQLLSQSILPFEIIVVDQTKVQDTETDLFLKKHSESGDIILLKESIPNAARARNVGMQYANGDIVLFLDDDVLFDKNFIESHLKSFQDRNVHAVQGVVCDETNKILYEREKVHQISKNKEVKFINLPSGNSSILKCVVLALAGFDERFVYSSTHEDTDFSIRFHEKGYNAIVCDDAKLIHLFSTGGGRSSVKNKMIPTKHRLIPQIYFYLKNSEGVKFIDSLITIWKECVFNWYKFKHPVIFVKSFYVFCWSLYIALRIKNKKTFDPKRFVN